MGAGCACLCCSAVYACLAGLGLAWLTGRVSPVCRVISCGLAGGRSVNAKPQKLGYYSYLAFCAVLSRVWSAVVGARPTAASPSVRVPPADLPCQAPNSYLLSYFCFLFLLSMVTQTSWRLLISGRGRAGSAECIIEECPAAELVC